MLVVITAGKQHCFGKNRYLKTLKIMSTDYREMQKYHQNTLLVKKRIWQILVFIISFFLKKSF